MRVLIATAQPYLPEIVGGMQRSCDILIKKLNESGHECAILTSLMGKGFFGFRQRVKKKIFRNKLIHDRSLGYLTYRSWAPWEELKTAATDFNPDIIIIPCGKPVKMALSALKLSVPSILWLQNVEFSDHGDDFKKLGNIPCVANSQFTAKKYKDAYGVNPQVINPIIDFNDYKTDTTREHVTFINPHPSKGLDLAMEIAAACPEIPFSFIKTWTQTADEDADLRNLISHTPNVSLVEPTNNMKSIYSGTKLLLVPSMWEEAYGRVASEVQISGIPVVASNIGGLPEAVGDGGVLLNPKGDVGPWVSAVKQLWSDEHYYEEKVQSSLKHAHRPALEIETQYSTWEKLLSDLVVSNK